MIRERKRRHDDMHFPLGGSGKRATKRIGGMCDHALLDTYTGKCANCGKQIKPLPLEEQSNG